MPYVLAIWAYEHMLRRWTSNDDSWQRKSHLHPLFAKQFSSSRKRGLAALTSKSDASLARPANTEARLNSAGANDLSDLKQMISKLSARVEELTSRLKA
ncbi:MAG: hypothetical protein MMC33_005786 [Icmadophila ericetorum]|nr:hypothetical protein [Icmadophila ericetorum]